MMRTALSLLIVSLVLLAGVRSTHAAQVYLDIVTLDDQQVCDLVIPGGFVPGSVKVRVTSPSVPFTKIRFKAPTDCQPVTGITCPFPYTGDISTGIEVTLPECMEAPFDLMQINYFRVSEVTCTWEVQPADGDGYIVAENCDGDAISGASARGLYCGDSQWGISPYQPDPPNGATGVPLDVKLSWEEVGNVLYFQAGDPGNSWPALYCAWWGGTQYDPNLPTCGPKPFDVGILEPNTTYYWRVGNECGPHCYHGEGAWSELWSFTTGSSTVAVEETTWGRVKALYRE